MDTFIAYVRLPDGGGDWHAEFPDLPGCTATGSNLDAVIDAARDALTIHIAELMAQRRPVPRPREAADMMIAVNEDPALARRVVGAVLTPVVPRAASAIAAKTGLPLSSERRVA